jgi:hypothetical protein
MFSLRGGPPSFDRLQWDTAAEFPTPYASHHHRGVIRLALEVDDLAAAYETLLVSRWAADGRVVLGPPEVWDYGRSYGVREVLNFANPEGVYFQLHQQPR